MGVDYSTDNSRLKDGRPQNGSYTPNSTHHPQSYHTKALSHDLSSKPIKYRNQLTQNRSISSSTALNSKPAKTEKIIYIEADNKKRVQISFEISEEDNLTCGWLVSETIRQFANHNLQEPYPKRPIVALQTLDNIVTLDYWLSDLERSVKVLQDRMILKPYYGNTEYSVTNQKISLQYFHILKLIGTGGFSKVYLARRKDNGQFYAIKVISKKEMIEKDKEENVFNERNIMTRLDHPFLVKLHYAFQTPEKLFLVMDFCPGGELFYHLNQRQKLREDEVKLYMGEIILALNYLHKNNIIYRDLKPENILLDIDGHLHLADFGLCKVTRNKSDLNYTFCGSPEYMAPEVVTKSGYNFSADFYTLGTLVYEMVVGRPPFNADRQKDLYDKIVNQEPYYPPHISPNLKLFISQLIEKNPNERLGSKHGLSEVVNHPWCRDLDIVKTATKKIKASIVPDIYRTNFAREFIDARATFINEYTPSASPINQQNAGNPGFGESGQEGENQAMYGKFANFSFYSNIDDPYEKFQDSIFESNENSPESSPKEKHKNHTGRIFVGEILKGLDAEEGVKRQGNRTLESKKSYELKFLEKGSKEDYTEELNETSPNTKYFNKYSKQDIKFFSRPPPGRSITPYFEKRNTFEYLDKTSNTNNKSLLTKGVINPINNNYNRNHSLTYKSSPKNTRPYHEQIPAKNIFTVTNTPNASFRDQTMFGHNINEILDEVPSKNDKPTTQILNKREYYIASQGSFKLENQANGAKKSQSLSLKQSGPISFFNKEENTPSNYKNITGEGKDFKGLGKLGMSEKITPK